MREALLAAEAAVSGGASPRVIPFGEVRDYGALLQRAGFALPVSDVDTLTVRYDTLFGLMLDLRAMGMTNPLVGRSRKPVPRGFFETAGADLPRPLRRSRWTRARDIFHRLPFRLGAA